MQFQKIFHIQVELISEVSLILHLSKSDKKWRNGKRKALKNAKIENRLVPPPLREKEAYMRGVKKGVRRGHIQNLTKYSSYWTKISGKSKKSDFSYNDFIKGS